MIDKGKVADTGQKVSRSKITDLEVQASNSKPEVKKTRSSIVPASLVAVVLLAGFTMLVLGINQLFDNKMENIPMITKVTRLAEVDGYADLHTEINCNDRERVVEHEFNGGFDYTCEPCKPTKLPNENKDLCVYPDCNKDSEFIT